MSAAWTAETAAAACGTQLYYGGKFVSPSSTFEPGLNPATGAPLPPAPRASAADVDAAVQAAAAAFHGPGGWGSTPPAARAAAVRRLADCVEAAAPRIAAVEAFNTGKPLREAAGDVEDAVAALRYAARQADALAAGSWPYPSAPTEALPMADETGRISYAPVGVVAAVCPFNFPAMMAAWKIGPALAAGCCIVVKPSEFTPFSALALAEAATAAGLPPGVLNVVTGGGDVGAALTGHALVDKVTFTGSVPTGAKVAAASGAALKRCTLELGGKSPALVFADADLDAALEWLFFGFAWNGGQICSATARLLVHSSVAGEVVRRLAGAAGRVRAGGPFDEGVELGPIINEMQYKKVRAFIETGKAEGCAVACGGGGPPAGLPPAAAGGFFLAPTIFTGVTPAHTLFREEVFGPVATVTTFETEDEAVALANDSAFGLAAAVFSADEARAARVADRLRAGTVWVNHAQPSPHALPWGGFKASGVGREMGPFALLPFLEQKSVNTWRTGGGAPTTPLGWYPASHFA